MCFRVRVSLTLTDYAPLVFENRPVPTCMPGGVGAGGEKPPATRLEQINVVLSVVDCVAKRLPKPHGLAMTHVKQLYRFVIANPSIHSG